MDFIVFVISLAALIYGADVIIRQSEKIALHKNIPDFIIGASVVAIGTSLPEFGAATSATLQDKDSMAVANVIGSVIFNIAFVLGLVFLLSKKPLIPERDLFFKDSAWTIFPLFAFLLIGMDGEISRVDGLVMFLLIAGYILFLLQDAKELSAAVELDKDDIKSFSWPKTLTLLVGGFVLVGVGADFTIASASNLARDLGIEEWIIGIFLIAFGTSLPELVVSIAAARKGKGDMSVGNIIGSNIANLTVVLGGAALIRPISVDFSAFSFDILAAVFLTIMLVFITANRLYNRSAGIALIALFVLIIDHSLRSVL